MGQGTDLKCGLREEVIRSRISKEVRGRPHRQSGKVFPGWGTASAKALGGCGCLRPGWLEQRDRGEQ